LLKESSRVEDAEREGRTQRARASIPSPAAVAHHPMRAKARVALADRTDRLRGFLMGHGLGGFEREVADYSIRAVRPLIAR
jgi:hypothetical protein